MKQELIKYLASFFGSLDRSKTGARILGSIEGLRRFHHHEEAATIAQEALANQRLRITSTERKLLHGAAIDSSQKASQANPKTPTF